MVLVSCGLHFVSLDWKILNFFLSYHHLFLTDVRFTCDSLFQNIVLAFCFTGLKNIKFSFFRTIICFWQMFCFTCGSLFQNIVLAFCFTGLKNIKFSFFHTIICFWQMFCFTCDSLFQNIVLAFIPVVSMESHFSLIIGLCILLRVYQPIYVETFVRNKCRCSFYCALLTLHFHCLEALSISTVLLGLSPLHWSPNKEDVHCFNSAQKKNVNSVEMKSPCCPQPDSSWIHFIQTVCYSWAKIFCWVAVQVYLQAWFSGLALSGAWTLRPERPEIIIFNPFTAKPHHRIPG
jgi:hypothetical protein